MAKQKGLDFNSLSLLSKPPFMLPAAYMTSLASF